MPSLGDILTFSLEGVGEERKRVVLSNRENKVCYISDADAMPYITCLKLGRKVYGVVSGISSTEFSETDLELSSEIIGQTSQKSASHVANKTPSEALNEAAPEKVSENFSKSCVNIEFETWFLS